MKQITNAYGFTLPPAAADLVRAMSDRGPPPDDDSQRRADESAATHAMLAGQSAEEQVRAFAGSGELGDALAALARALEKRESTERSESGPQGKI